MSSMSKGQLGLLVKLLRKNSYHPKVQRLRHTYAWILVNTDPWLRLYALEEYLHRRQEMNIEEEHDVQCFINAVHKRVELCLREQEELANEKLKAKSEPVSDQQVINSIKARLEEEHRRRASMWDHLPPRQERQLSAAQRMSAAWDRLHGI